MAANLFRVGKIWHFRFQIDGVRCQRSTNESSRVRAECIAADAYRSAAIWARRDRSIPTLAELVVQWLADHQQTVSQSHLRGVEAFGRLHLYDLGDIPIDRLTTA